MPLMNIENSLNHSLMILNQFKWLTDSYVLDFYTEKHWNRLPKIWKATLEQVEPEILIDLFKLESDSSRDQILWPLSLICLRSLVQQLNISRHNQYVDKKHLQLEPMCYRHTKLKNAFRKRIKPKKLHEIERMAALCSRTATDCHVEYVLDFGAGLGHLARVLGYGYGLSVCCLEQQKRLSEEAKLIDEKLYRTACQFLECGEIKRLRRPVHLNVQLTVSTDTESLLNQISECFNIPNDKRDKLTFGIVGLHPCGDLAAILLNVFLKCKEAKFINIAGCCYMKMTESSFPLSNYLRRHSLSHLSYEAKEISCHHQEIYVQRLADRNYDHLMIHSYRAAIEKIISKYWPELKHIGLKSIKHSTGLTFSDYCSRATSHLRIVIPEDEIFSAEVQRDLRCWKKIVIFYTLRLMMAPLVESVILYDRMLYVLEKHYCVQSEALFDPVISPRNVVITAVKHC
ncbi:hypothetical protein HA402_016200 [Bradysia odoriphaga]|nr:hypothetical protein HA402_016200 [Bradysia odoriphaga]